MSSSTIHEATADPLVRLYEKSVTNRYRKLWSKADQRKVYQPIVEVLDPVETIEGIRWVRRPKAANRVFDRAASAVRYSTYAQARYARLYYASLGYEEPRILRFMRWLLAHGLPSGLYHAWYRRWVRGR